MSAFREPFSDQPSVTPSEQVHKPGTYSPSVQQPQSYVVEQPVKGSNVITVSGAAKTSFEPAE